MRFVLLFFTSAVCCAASNNSSHLCHIYKDTNLCYPAFINIGVAKSGTGTLQTLLKHHPQVHFFGGVWNNGETHALEDLTLQRLQDEDAVTELHVWNVGFFNVSSANITEVYLRNILPQVRPGDVDEGGFQLRQMPDTKIVLLARHPVDRAYSNFIELSKMSKFHSDYPTFASYLRRTFERMPFFQSCQLTVDNYRFSELRECIESFEHGVVDESHLRALFGPRSRISTANSRVDAIVRSLYHIYLSHWLQNGYEINRNLLILPSEDFFQHQVESLNEICSFVGLERFNWSSLISELQEKDRRQYGETQKLSTFNPKAREKSERMHELHIAAMANWERKLLLSFYRPYTLKFLKFLGWDEKLKHWLV